MRLLELHREATFEVTDGADAAALLGLVRERVAHHGAERLTVRPGRLEFDAGGPFSDAFRWPWNPLRGLGDCGVSIRTEGERAFIRFDLELPAFPWFVGFALVALFGGFVWISIGTPIPLLGWALFFFLARLAGRAIVGARFGSLLERALRPHARPLQHR